MKKATMVAVLAAILASPAHAEMPETVIPELPAERIARISAEYGVSASVMTGVATCESSLRPDAVGDHGNSYGMVQIHLPSHPSVRKEQALDPEFALRFLAYNLKLEKGRLWTCYRNLYPSKGASGPR